MLNVIRKTPNEVGQYSYKKLVDETLYPTDTWIHSPDVSNVSAIPVRYWKWNPTTSIVDEMSTTEKEIVDTYIESPPTGDGTVYVNVISILPDEIGVHTFKALVNEELYPVESWVHNPDYSEVNTVPRKYWKWDASENKIISMTPVEMQILDDHGMNVIDDENGNTIQIDISDSFERSTIDGKKLAVHSSYKPELEDSTTYAIWTGAGDDLTAETGGCGEGELLQLHSVIGEPETSVDIKFNPIFGRVWLHEAYIKFTDGGMGDYMSARIYASGVPLQEVANLDLIVVDDYIKYSTSGPGTGTHGFADASAITLIDRSFSKDGDWDYEGNELTPNFSGTGHYKMSTIDQVVHKFVNKVSCYGSCSTYFSMSSDETSSLKAGYFARMTIHNVSNTLWHCSAIMELYREVTHSN